NNVNMIIRAAIAGFGLAFVMENHVEAHLAGGRLVRVLKDWCAPFSGYHLYYPSRHQPSAAFAATMRQSELLRGGAGRPTRCGCHRAPALLGTYSRDQPRYR